MINSEFREELASSNKSRSGEKRVLKFKLRIFTLICMIVLVFVSIQSFTSLFFYTAIFVYGLAISLIASSCVKCFFSISTSLEGWLRSSQFILVITGIALFLLLVLSHSKIKDELLIEGKIIKEQCVAESSCPSYPEGYESQYSGGVIRKDKKLPLWLLGMPYSVGYSNARNNNQFFLRVSYGIGGGIVVFGGVDEEVE